MISNVNSKTSSIGSNAASIATVEAPEKSSTTESPIYSNEDEEYDYEDNLSSSEIFDKLIEAEENFKKNTTEDNQTTEVQSTKKTAKTNTSTKSTTTLKAILITKLKPKYACSNHQAPPGIGNKKNTGSMIVCFRTSYSNKIDIRHIFNLSYFSFY